jgi:hypothetical protein
LIRSNRFDTVKAGTTIRMSCSRWSSSMPIRKSASVR